MPRTSTRIRRRLVVLANALLASVILVVLSGAVVASAATPTPTPSPSPGASDKTKPPTVTFGIGASNGKALDGRSSFSYSASPGSVIGDHLAIVNISAQPLNLLLYGTDAINSTTGSLAYKPETGSHTGASAWLALPEVNHNPILTIKARATLILPFQIRIPANASPGDHTAGIALGLLANVVGNSTKNLHFEQRVVERVYVRVSGTAVAKLAVDDVNATYHQSWNPISAGSVTVTYVVRNTGNVDLGAKQVMSLTGIFGHLGSVPKLPVLTDLLPGSSSTFTVKVNGVWPEFLLNGSVHVTPTAISNSVDPALHVASASTSFWAIPWALLILIVILVVGGFFLRRYLRKRSVNRRKPSHSKGRNGKSVPVDV